MGVFTKSKKVGSNAELGIVKDWGEHPIADHPVGPGIYSGAEIPRHKTHVAWRAVQYYGWSPQESDFDHHEVTRGLKTNASDEWSAAKLKHLPERTNLKGWGKGFSNNGVKARRKKLGVKPPPCGPHQPYYEEQGSWLGMSATKVTAFSGTAVHEWDRVHGGKAPLAVEHESGTLAGVRRTHKDVLYDQQVRREREADKKRAVRRREIATGETPIKPRMVNEFRRRADNLTFFHKLWRDHVEYVEPFKLNDSEDVTLLCLAAGLTEWDVRVIKNRFDLVDADGSGSMDKGEYLSLLRCNSNHFTDALFRIVDADDSGTLNFHEFAKLLVTFNLLTVEEVARFVFRVYNSSKSGQLQEEEYRLLRSKTKYLPAYGATGMPPHEYDDVLLQFGKDKGGCGSLGVDEFVTFTERYPVVLHMPLQLQKHTRTVRGAKRWKQLMREGRRRQVIRLYMKHHQGKMPPLTLLQKTQVRLNLKIDPNHEFRIMEGKVRVLRDHQNFLRTRETAAQEYHRMRDPYNAFTHGHLGTGHIW